MTDNRQTRQTFLGNQEVFQRSTIGIVGLGGGGSHIVQQLSHIGFSRLKIFDPDTVEESNLNRLVGATTADIGKPKVDVAERIIKSLNLTADLGIFQCRWEDAAQSLKECDIVFGCIDSFLARRDLEVCTRRYLIPYIDIGMDVHVIDGQPPRMAGQVILSMPGGPCMFCLGFLNDQRLANEASQYGDAGPRPQVVWPNGILASSAVGIAVDLLTSWSGVSQGIVYLSYDGNKGTLTPHIQWQHLNNKNCSHYNTHEVGYPLPVKMKQA